ncbi:MAG TPA: NAD(P)-dependent oxidoreductase [Solirubrobacteraceae bacterium]|nr:NAD(P)-dependent oxidoreductase [Solirubrobacteraceae bacterium]
MNVLVAGATGAIGRQLVPALRAAGHDVTALVRSAAGEDAAHALGATAVRGDALDRAAVVRAVATARPEVIVHQLTALAGSLDLRRFDRSFAQTNRLRTEGTEHLLAAAWEVGVRRVVAGSYAGWPFARTGGPVKTEDDPLDPAPAAAMRQTLAAIRFLEEEVLTAEGIVLRYGAFYGPGTGLAPGGDELAAIRRRRVPVVGDGAGVWSFVHVADAAEATVAAIEADRPGLYNVVDDEPAPVRVWLPEVAREIGAKPPRHVPRPVGSLLAGEAATVMMTEVRGASNAKAKAELGWTPRHPSWRGRLGAGGAAAPRAAAPAEAA